MTLTSDDEAIIVVCVIFAGYPFLICLTALVTFIQKRYMKYKFEHKWDSVLQEARDDEDDLAMLKYQISKDEGAHASVRTKFKDIWEHSATSFLWNCLQAFLTIVALYAYIQELYEDPNVPKIFLVLEGFLSIMFLLDMCLLFFLAPDKVEHLLSPFPFFDWISVIPFFFFWGFGNPFLTGESNNSLLFLRSLRIFRAFRVVRLYRLIPIVVERDTVKAHLFQVIVMICGLVYVATGAMQFFEDNLDPIRGLDSNQPFPWHTAFYFMIVTLTTVGYGDISPVTQVGRAVIIIFLLWSVSIVPYTIGTIRAIMETTNRYDLVEYSGGPNHIIVIGDLTGNELSLFLKEWFHDDANHHNARVVIVSVKSPSKDLKRTLKSGLGEQMVTYVKGSPLDEYVLVQRAKIHKASFCLLLTKASHPLTLTYLAVKSVNKDMKIIVRALDALLQSHFPIEEGDIVIRPSEVRRSLAASSVLLPGASSLLPGLLFSLNEKDMVEVEPGSWKQEFMESLSEELYSFPCPASLNGQTFSGAALSLYRAYHVILVAATVEIKTHTGGTRRMVLLNPRSSVARLTAGAILYAIAPDYSFILDLFGINYNPLGSLVQVVPQNVERLSRWQGRESQGDALGEQEENSSLLDAGGYSSLRVTVDTEPGATVPRVGFQDLELDEDDEREKPTKDRRFLQALQQWNTKRDVTFFEHVVLGFRSVAGGVNWESVYMLLDHLRLKEEVVYEPEAFARKKNNLSNHLIFIGPCEGFLELVGPLRLYHSKSHPVIVATFLENDKDLDSAVKIARSFDDIYIVMGNGHDITTAFFCGVDRCGHICIAPRSSAKYGELEDDPYLVDAETVFTVRFCKRLYKRMKKPPPTFQVELCYHENTKFLEIDDEDSPIFGKTEETKDEEDDGCCCGRCAACHKFCVDMMFCRQYKRWWRKFKIGIEGGDLPPLEPVVGSGQVFFSSFMLRMLVSTFNGDGGVYELFLLFLRRSRFPETLDFSATLRLIAVPDEFVGESFEDMFAAYASKPNPIILIGLYRVTYEDGRNVRYAVANPRPTFLRKDDRVYALLNDQHENLGISMYASMG